MGGKLPCGCSEWEHELYKGSDLEDENGCPPPFLELPTVPRDVEQPETRNVRTLSDADRRRGDACAGGCQRVYTRDGVHEPCVWCGNNEPVERGLPVWEVRDGVLWRYRYDENGEVKSIGRTPLGQTVATSGKQGDTSIPSTAEIDLTAALERARLAGGIGKPFASALEARLLLARWSGHNQRGES